MTASGSSGRLLTVPEAADYLGISAGTLRNWLSMKRLEHVKVGRLTRVSMVVLERYVRAHTIPAVDDKL